MHFSSFRLRVIVLSPTLIEKYLFRCTASRGFTHTQLFLLTFPDLFVGVPGTSSTLVAFQGKLFFFFTSPNYTGFYTEVSVVLGFQASISAVMADIFEILRDVYQELIQAGLPAKPAEIETDNPHTASALVTLYTLLLKAHQTSVSFAAREFSATTSEVLDKLQDEIHALSVCPPPSPLSFLRDNDR